jgi:ADP-ribosylglycohydrolase
LPYEGLSPRRASKLLGEPERYRFLLRRGMVSDDTEHSCMVLQALAEAGGDPDRFVRGFARRLRWWLLGLSAGVGLATLKATLKLCVGFCPEHSGVFSAGNGPAMRSAVLGAAVADDQKLALFVRASTRLTHTDPKAYYGAIAVAIAARMAAAGEPVNSERFASDLRQQLAKEPAQEFLELVERALTSAANGEATADFAATLGLGHGVSGYVYHTVPIAIHAWQRSPRDLSSALSSVIRCGGDTDTTAAIVGGIVGAAVGRRGIPAAWLDGLAEWPRSVAWMERLAESVSRTVEHGEPCRSPGLPVLPLLLRNLFFLVVVLAHAVRRLLPPY